MSLYVYDINSYFETEAKQNYIPVYVPKVASVISVCPNTKSKSLMEVN